MKEDGDFHNEEDIYESYERVIKENEELLVALKSLIDPDACELEPDGRICYMHGYRSPCANETARKLVDRLSRR